MQQIFSLIIPIAACIFNMLPTLSPTLFMLTHVIRIDAFISLPFTCGHSQFSHWFCSQVGNIGGREFAESLAPDVQKLLVRAQNLFVSHLSL